MNEMKSTFNYILNNLALSSLIFRTIDSNEVASEQDKIDMKHQIELLQQENKQLKEQLEYLRSGEYYNQLRFERDMLQNVVDNGEVSKEDKEFIDMTHRNTELLEQLKQRDEVIDEAIKKVKVVKEYKFDLIGRYEILDILQKYKGDNNE